MIRPTAAIAGALAVLALNVLALAAVSPARAQVPDCRLEMQPAARAACLSAEADTLILRMDTRIAAITAGLDAVRLDLPQAEDTFGGRLAASQTAWLERMEESCAAITAPDRGRERLARATCRLDEAEARAVTLDTALAPAFGPGSGRFTGFSPFIRVRPTPEPGGGWRARPEILLGLPPP